MHAYVTLFNVRYLLQGIILIKSFLSKNNTDCFYILCLDDTTYNVLESYKFNRVILINKKTFESNNLIEIKKSRTFGEYCWTITPFSIKYIFQNNNIIDSVTYVDADIIFLRNTKLLYQNFFELHKNVLLTYHGYDPSYDASEHSGKYCVQFLTFKKDNNGILENWAKQCLDWCYNRYEDGKFGDQMYLNDWEEVYFEDVSTISNYNFLLAPWNANRFPYSEACLYHFHSLKIYMWNNKFIFDIGLYYIPDPCYKNIYLPYFNMIKSEFNNINGKNIPGILNNGNIIMFFKAFAIHYIFKWLKINKFLHSIRILQKIQRYRVY